jgi:hypothetical protein
MDTVGMADMVMAGGSMDRALDLASASDFKTKQALRRAPVLYFSFSI